MKILLDECVTHKLKKFLQEYEVFTVTEMGFSGLKNGKLLATAQSSGFDMLLTIDKNIDYQQNIANFDLSVVVLDVIKSNIKYLEPLIPEFEKQLDNFEKGKSYLVK